MQGWPKCGPRAACGPPKIFCGPCVKFWMNHLAFYDTFMLKLAQIMSSFKKNKPKNFFCGPHYNILKKFGPQAKKSGHPCFIIKSLTLWGGRGSKIVQHCVTSFMYGHNRIPKVERINNRFGPKVKVAGRVKYETNKKQEIREHFL